MASDISQAGPGAGGKLLRADIATAGGITMKPEGEL